MDVYYLILIPLAAGTILAKLFLRDKYEKIFMMAVSIISSVSFCARDLISIGKLNYNLFICDKQNNLVSMITVLFRGFSSLPIQLFLSFGPLSTSYSSLILPLFNFYLLFFTKSQRTVSDYLAGTHVRQLHYR